MVLLMLSGATGSVLHFRASMEFKREVDPSLSGFALFSSVVQAKAPPALSPGTLALLGLLGFAVRFVSIPRLFPETRKLRKEPVMPRHRSMLIVTSRHARHRVLLGVGPQRVRSERDMLM